VQATTSANPACKLKRHRHRHDTPLVHHRLLQVALNLRQQLPVHNLAQHAHRVGAVQVHGAVHVLHQAAGHDDHLQKVDGVCKVRQPSVDKAICGAAARCQRMLLLLSLLPQPQIYSSTPSSFNGCCHCRCSPPSRTSSLPGQMSLMQRYTMRRRWGSRAWNSFVAAKNTSLASFCSGQRRW